MRRVPALEERAAVELLHPFPAAQSTVHDAELAIIVAPLPQRLSVSASVTYGMVHRIGSHVKHANIPSEQAAGELLVSCGAMRNARH